MSAVQIHVTADFVCPWCWIGYRQLKDAIAMAGLDVPPHIHYLPFELNPDMPPEGMPRRAYRTAKFGSWARSQMLDAEVAARGKSVGLCFYYERVAITPNTRLAHRLMAFAQAFGDAARVDTLFDSIFAAYFDAGRDIGKLDVLVSLAARTGFDAEAVRDFLLSNAGDHDVIAAELSAMDAGVRAVPSIRIADMTISGAQAAVVLAESLQRARAALMSC
jgi:predicted DsbA family dithiol-disulfide isomerase